MNPTRCILEGKPGTVKRTRLRDDGSVVAHVRLDDGPLRVVLASEVLGQATEQELADNGPTTGSDEATDD